MKEETPLTLAHSRSVKRRSQHLAKSEIKSISEKHKAVSKEVKERFNKLKPIPEHMRLVFTSKRPNLTNE